MLNLIPNRTRDYASLGALIEDLAAGRDFIVADVSSPWDGKPCNVHDLRRAGHKDVSVRYNKLSRKALVSLDMIG